jgi:hypothetical protein
MIKALAREKERKKRKEERVLEEQIFILGR